MSLTIFLAGPLAARHSAMSAFRRHIGASHDVPAGHGIPSAPTESWLAYQAEELPSRELLDALEQHEWRLRLHRLTPPARPPLAVPDPFVEIAELKARISALENGRPYLPPMGGGSLETPPYVIAASQHPAYLFRQAAQSMLSGTGVDGLYDLLVVAQSPAAMGVQVDGGTCWIPGTTSAGTTGWNANAGAQTSVSNTNGGSSTSTGYPTSFTSQASYFAYNDGAVNLSIASADATNPRIDLVCASVLDAEYAGSQNEAILQVVTGTAAATPAPPAPPANSIVLGSVWVPAAATSISSGDITDLRPGARLGLIGPWQTLPLATGVVAVTGDYTPSARIEAGLVRLRGSINNNTGAAIGGPNNITGLAAGMAPSSNALMAAGQVGSGAASGIALFATGEYIQISSAGPSWAAGNDIPLNGLTYTL